MHHLQDKVPIHRCPVDILKLNSWTWRAIDPTDMSTDKASYSNSRSKVCVKYAGPMELWNDALVTPCEGQSRRRLSHLRLSANTEMLRTACFLYVIGHRELLGLEENLFLGRGQLDTRIAHIDIRGLLFATVDAVIVIAVCPDRIDMIVRERHCHGVVLADRPHTESSEGPGQLCSRVRQTIAWHRREHVDRRHASQHPDDDHGDQQFHKRQPGGMSAWRHAAHTSLPLSLW